MTGENHQVGIRRTLQGELGEASFANATAFEAVRSKAASQFLLALCREERLIVSQGGQMGPESQYVAWLEGRWYRVRTSEAGPLSAPVRERDVIFVENKISLSTLA